MSLPTISQLSAIQKADATILLTALFSDGQIMLGHSKSSGPWSWETVNVPTPLDSAPTSLTYPTTLATVTVGAALAVPVYTPKVVSGVWPASFTVSPGLPAGLSLNAATGVISGTPTTPTVQATYTVTATNTYGSTTAALVITVIAVAPAALTYMAQPLVTKLNTAITPITPNVYGGTVVSYGISPALPAGLTLNTTTGVLSGTPTVESVPTVYTVTATNTGGSTTASFTLSVGIAGLTTTQFAALTTAQITALTTSDIVGLSTGEIAALSTSEIAVLTTSEVHALTTTDLATLSTTQDMALSTTQLAALSTTQLAALTTHQ